MKATIYEIKNEVTGKNYVGATTIPLEQRFSWHKSKSNSHSKEMYSDMTKYGKDKFTIKELESGDYSKEELQLKETEYIIKLGSWENGYNTLISGGGGLGVSGKPKSIVQIDMKTLEIINVFNSISDATRELGIGKSNISEVVNGKRRSAGGFYWTSYENRHDFIEPQTKGWNGTPYKIAQIDMITGELIKIHDSIYNASKEIEGSAGVISNIINGIGKTYKGYRWERVE